MRHYVASAAADDFLPINLLWYNFSQMKTGMEHEHGMADRVGGFREKAGGDVGSTSHPPEFGGGNVSSLFITCP